MIDSKKDFVTLYVKLRIYWLKSLTLRTNQDKRSSEHSHLLHAVLLHNLFMSHTCYFRALYKVTLCNYTNECSIFAATVVLEVIHNNAQYNSSHDEIHV